MAITYTWKVVRVKTTNTDSFENAIVNVWWQKIGTDDVTNVTGYFEGATPFDADQIDPDNFTALDQLTEEMVLSWVQGVVVGEYENHVHREIQRDINDKIGTLTEIEEGQLPWNVVEETPEEPV